MNTVDPTCITECVSPSQGMHDISLVFDGVMETAKKHLFEEFQQQRLRGTDYAKVYVSSIESVLANTTQYLVGTSLTNEQRSKLHADIRLTNKQLEKIDKEIDLLDKQIDKLDVEILLTKAQTRAIDAEIDLKLPKELEILDAQIEKSKEEVLNIRANTDKVSADKALVESQKVLIDQQISKKLPQEVLKLQSEILLLGAKTNTEKLQPDLVTKQKELLVAQRIGFKGKLEEAVAKMCTDAYAVTRTSNDATPTPDTLRNADVAIRRVWAIADQIY